MTATKVLEYKKEFNDVPLKSTKRGFAIPRPAVLRTTNTGGDNPKDKEWDGRSFTGSKTPQQYYLGHMVYQPTMNNAAFTKSVVDATEVSLAVWQQAMVVWRQYLRDNAEQWTSTHKAVNGGYVNANLLSHSSNATMAAVLTPAAPAAPAPDPIVPTPVPSTVPMVASWDPTDVDIAHDLFNVPVDNPNFIPDAETFQMLDLAWKQANQTGHAKTILIYGDTSTGKTEHPLIWCARNDVLLCRIDCGAFGEIYDVTGPIKASNENGISITEWVKGKTIRAMADPRPRVIQLDEVNRISDVKAMNVLFPFLDSARQSYFDDAQAWMKLNGIAMIIATMNGDTRGDDIGEYVGTQPLDQAFVSRFPIRRQLRYPNPQKLVEILDARYHNVIVPETLQTVAEIANELVAANKFVPNLREIFAALDFIADGLDPFLALKWTLGGVYKNDGTPNCDWRHFRGVLVGKNIAVKDDD